MSTRKSTGLGVVLASCSGQIVSNGPINTYAFGVLLKPVAMQLGLSRGTLSGAMALALLATAFASPFFGIAVDRFGVRRSLLLATPAYALGLALLALLPSSKTGVLLLFALAGVLAVGQTPTAYSKAVSVWYDHKRGFALGIAMAGVGLGTVLMPQYARLLILNFGWRQAYLGLSAAVVALALLPVFFFIREPNLPLKRSWASTKAPGLSGAQAIHTPQLWKITGAFFLAGIVIVGTLAHLAAMLSDRGFSIREATAELSIAGVALIFGRILAGYALDLIFAPYVATFFFVCPMVGIAMLLLGGSFSVTALGSVLLGVSIGGDIDILPFIIGRYFGFLSFGRLYSAVFSIFLLGNATGVALLGFIFDRTGSYRTPLLLSEPLLMLSCLLLIGLGPYKFPETATAV